MAKKEIKTVFLSSTARDLARYRQAVTEAINGLGDYKCVRMEDFGARLGGRRLLPGKGDRVRPLRGGRGPLLWQLSRGE